MKILKLTGIITFAIAGLLFAESCESGDKSKNTTAKEVKKPQPPRPANAVLAPDFTLATLNGDIVSLNDLKGKVILLNFWATWCPPCRKEIPDFIKLYDKYNKDGLEIVGVTLNSGALKDVQTFVKQNKMNYPILTDIDGQETQMTAMKYGKAVNQPITGVPTSFIIDRDGYIVKMYIGPRSEQVFYNDLKPYI